MKNINVKHNEEESNLKAKEFEKILLDYILKDNDFSLEVKNPDEDGCILQSFD